MPAPKTTRRLLALGALLAAAFAVYGSLVPLHVRHVPLTDAIAEFRAVEYIPFADASKTDFLSNVVLFLPIGFLVTGAIASGRRRSLVAALVPLVTVAAFIFSVGIEFSQIFVIGRTPSYNDIVNETTGAALGALAWLPLGGLVTGWLRGLAPATGSRTEMARRVLTGYAAIWLLLGLLPFDVTIRPAELAEKFRMHRIRIVPLHDGLLGGSEVIASTALLAIPVGALAALGWPRSRRVPNAVAGAIVGALTVAALECCQVFVFSRTASVDDVIGGAIGASAGAWLAARLAGSNDSATSSARLRFWPLGLLLVWILVILLRHWAPFNFAVTGDMWRSRWPALVQVPFSNYYWANPFDALSEAITKVFLGLPVGVLLALGVPRPAATAWRWLRLAAFAAFALALFSSVELGQVFLPSRYPDGTDIVLGTVGVWLGLAGDCDRG